MSQGPSQSIVPHLTPDAQGKRWCLTLYDEDDVALLKAATPVALVIALEEGTEEKREHYQVYVKFASNKRWSWFKRTFSSSAHWELAKTPEWACRRYIVDVEAYLRESPQAHPKAQGQVLVDFGCQVHYSAHLEQDQRIVKAMVDGATEWQLFKDNPMYFFHQGRKISDLHAKMTAWREMGVDYKPDSYDDYRPGKKGKAKPE